MATTNINALLSFAAFSLATIFQATLIWRYRREDVPLVGKTLLGISVLLSMYLAASYGYIGFVEDVPGFGARWLRPALIGVAFIITVESGYMLDFFRANEKQRRLMDERLDFISRASHELRTPLTVVHGNLEMAVRYWDDDRINNQKIVTSAYRASVALRSLIENMSIMEGNGRAYSDMHLSAIVQSVCSEYLVLAAHTGIILNCDIEPEIMLHGDDVGIRASVVALVDNAMKFGAKNVGVVLIKKGERIMLTVTDDGIGIPRLFHRTIFEWGYQVDGTSTRLRNGLGIGLSLADEIVKKHKGSLTFFSRPGKGSVFMIRLPITSER